MNLLQRILNPETLRKGLISGSLASLLSAVVLVGRGHRETGSPWACLNAPSHWLWDTPALRQDAASLRYTATGALVHHASACFWGVLHEATRSRLERGHTPGHALRDATVTTAIAAVVDLQAVPERLTPGFEHRLTRSGLFTVYLFFGAGLALASILMDRREGNAFQSVKFSRKR